MNQAIQFSNQNSSRNEAVIVADHGDRYEIRVWINPTSRFRTSTEMVEKRWVRKFVALGEFRARKLAEVAA